MEISSLEILILLHQAHNINFNALREQRISWNSARRVQKEH